MPRINPIQSLKGQIYLPASKSYSIRAAFIAACGGQSSIKGYSNCDDAIIAMQLSKSLGATIKGKKDFIIKAALAKRKTAEFQVGESGTSLRFLLPLLSLHCDKARVQGRGTLLGRPNNHLCASLRLAGMNIKGEGGVESVPIVYNGGDIHSAQLAVDGSLSSQFVSALLITAPRLAHPTTIKIAGKAIVSADYIDMTLRMLTKANIRIKRIDARTFTIKGNQTFKGLKNFTVPSDYGLAAFLLAAGALVPSNLILNGYFVKDLPQADGHILNFLKKMNVKFKHTPKALIIDGPHVLKGGTFSLSACPDLVPIMAVLGMFAKTPLKLTGISHARVKESNRIDDLARELIKVGAKIKVGADEMTIIPQEHYRSDAILDSHRDHRLAMAFTVLGLKVGCFINDIQCSHKSYPAFLKDMQRLGAKIV